VRVAVVVPNWNGRRWLPGLFDSLDAQTRAPDEVVVVDNGSIDGSVEWLRERGVRTVSLYRNTGFAHAANRGIEAVSAGLSGADYVFLAVPSRGLDEVIAGCTAFTPEAAHAMMMNRTSFFIRQSPPGGLRCGAQPVRERAGKNFIPPSFGRAVAREGARALLRVCAMTGRGSCIRSLARGRRLISVVGVVTTSPGECRQSASTVAGLYFTAAALTNAEG